MTKEAVEIRSGLTVKSLTLGLAIVIGLAIYMSYMYYTHAFSSVQNFTPSYWWTLSVWWMFWAGVLTTFFVPLIVFNLLPARMRLTPQELTVIFAMTLVVYPLIVKVGPELWCPGHIIGAGIPWFASDLPYIVRYMAPWHYNTIPIVDSEVKPELVNYINGGFVGRPLSVAVPVRWEAFMPGLTFCFFEIMFLLLMCIFIAAILRKQYVEIEALPFPNTTGAIFLITESTTKIGETSSASDIKSKLLRNKWMWIGILLAQVFMIPAWLGELLPFAGIPATPYEVYTATAKNIIIPYIPIAIVFTNPWALGLGLFMPTDVLISWFITWIVFIVLLTNIQWMAGLFPPMSPSSTMESYNGRAQNNWFLKVDPEGQGLCAWSFGILLVAAIYPMLVHRRHVIASIKAIFKPNPELEKGDVPYRWLYLGFLLSFIGYLAVFAITPAHLWMIALSMILLMITFIGGARLRAETGGYGGFWTSGYALGYRYPNHWWNRVVLKQMIGSPTPEGTVTGYNAQYFWTFQGCHGTFQNEMPPIGVPMFTMLEVFKIAHETKTKPRDLLIAVIIALIVAYWIGNPLIIWLRHTANWVEDSAPKWTIGHSLYTGGVASRGSPIGWRGYWYMGYGEPNGPDIPNTLIQYALGIIVGIVLFWLRAKFVWFIYNPLTIPLWGLFTNNADVFLMFAIALIVKFITIRVGGIPLYERRIVPLAVGLIIGGGLFFTIDDILFFAFRRTFL